MGRVDELTLGGYLCVMLSFKDEHLSCSCARSAVISQTHCSGAVGVKDSLRFIRLFKAASLFGASFCISCMDESIYYY